MEALRKYLLDSTEFEDAAPAAWPSDVARVSRLLEGDIEEQERRIAALRVRLEEFEV